MIKNIIIYLAILAASFVFSIYYYAWFSWFLLVLVICIPLLSLVISLPFMINSAINGFSVFAQKEVFKNQIIRLGIKSRKNKAFFCPFVKINFKAVNNFAGTSEKLCFKFCGTMQEPVFINSKKLSQNCGCVEIRAGWVKIYDLSGIFFIPIRAKRFTQTFVMPIPQEPAFIPDSEAMMILGYKAKSGGGFSEDYELRQYQSGDSLKNIHWKLSSKQDELIVREPSIPVYKQFIVKLALNKKALSNDSMLERFVYICNYLNENSVPFFCEANGAISKLQNSEQVEAFIKQLYLGKAFNKCEIDSRNSVVFSILPDCEEVSSK